MGNAMETGINLPNAVLGAWSLEHLGIRAL